MYEQIDFQTHLTRPFFFTNFVTTIDGKVQIEVDGKTPYWPIGSKFDFETLQNLRAHSDLLIHGKDTALTTRTIDGLYSPEFRTKRKSFGKEKDLLYAVCSNHPDDQLVPSLSNSAGAKPIIITNKHVKISEELKNQVVLLQAGEEKVDLKQLSDQLFQMEFKTILMEGGPHLLGSFLAADLIDEVFLTISPKIIGNKEKIALTLVEGYLFKPEEVKNLELLSFEKHENELYLRYQIKHS